MNKFLFAVFVLISVPLVSFAQAPAPALSASATVSIEATATITPAKPGLLPGDFFYFLDRWGEAVNLAFTFNKEDKARKHIEFAKERVAEMNQVLTASTTKLADIASAKENFDTQIADAALIVKAQKDNGADVANLAREFDDELDLSREALQDIYKNHRNKTIQAEVEIRAKLAALPADDPKVKGLTQALESITKEKEAVTTAESDVDAGIVEEQIVFEDVMGQQMAAGKHMEQALRLRNRLQAELPQSAATTSQKFIVGAEAAIKRGDFKSAKLMFKEAEHMIGEAIDMHDAQGVPNALSPINGAPMMSPGLGAPLQSGLPQGQTNGQQGNQGKPGILPVPPINTQPSLPQSGGQSGSGQSGKVPTALPPQAVFCTMDAKICPDGSAVGRIGPKCDFAPCQSSNVIVPPASGQPQSPSTKAPLLPISQNMLPKQSLFTAPVVAPTLPPLPAKPPMVPLPPVLVP